MRKPIFLLPFVAAFSSGYAPSAGAQGDDEVPTIYVREIMPRDVGLVPGAAARLTDEQIRAMRPYTLHDALDFVPGVRTIDDDAAARRSGIGIRGAPPRRSRKTLLLEDGTPINASTYLDSSAHYTPPMERLESIDVLKASGQIVHGPLNNHGIVNFRNKRATAVPETVVELTAGTLDTLRRHVMHRRTVGSVGLVGAYTGMDADGSFDIEETRFDDIYGSLAWQIDDARSLDFSFTYFRERSDYDESNLTPAEFAVAPRTKGGRFGQEHNTFALNYRKADIAYEVDIGANLSISTKLFATDVDRPRFTVVPGDSPIAALPDIVPENPFEPGVTGRMESRNRHYRTYGIETRMELATSGPHTLQWGLRAEDHVFDDMRNRADGGYVISENDRGALIRLEHYEAQAVSVFVQDVIDLGDWVVTPGLRAEEFTQSKIRLALPLDPGPHGPKERDRNSILLPGVTVLYTGISAAQVFGGLQRGYSPALARTAEDFPLLPEVGVNAQLGVRSTLGSRVRYEAAVFSNWLENTLVRQAFTIDGLNVTLNSGDSTARGLDLGLRLDSAEDPAAAGNMFLELAYNYTNAEFDGGPLNGRNVPEIPRQSGSMTLGYEHPSGWHFSGTVSHLGAFYTDVTNTETLTLVDEDDLAPLARDDDFSVREPIVVGRVPSRTLLSARVSYRLPGGNTTVWLQGRNLTDKLYITDVENGLRPGAERTIVAGARIQF
ncbi:MAG TPA: TonB-dependent receptor [Gammaproteobacteria bacterium]|nr:TonB-dependent receptor [Gammaproteobacteria bacterium]